MAATCLTSVPLLGSAKAMKASVGVDVAASAFGPLSSSFLSTLSRTFNFRCGGSVGLKGGRRGGLCVRAETLNRGMTREDGGQWLSSTTRHVRIYAAYIDPETGAFDQTQTDKLTLILDPGNEFVWPDDKCQKVYAYFSELIDAYEEIIFNYLVGGAMKLDLQVVKEDLSCLQSIVSLLLRSCDISGVGYMDFGKMSHGDQDDDESKISLPNPHRLPGPVFVLPKDARGTIFKHCVYTDILIVTC